MLSEWLTPGLLALLVVITLWIAFRRPPGDAAGERQTRELRDDLARSAQGTRQELGSTLADFQRTLVTQQGEVARTQNEQIDAFSRQLAAMQQQLADSLSQATIAQVEQARLARESLDAMQAAQGVRMTMSLRELADSLSTQLQALVRANDQRMSEVRGTVEQKLSAIQLDNEKKLEQIRATVDEKLHATLERRLGENFKQVAERLELVHSGLGEMRLLAKDVGSLSRVLGNVKTRGILGEVQLSGLLDQVFTIDQYETNVETVPGTGARVEFAIKLPGRRDDGLPLWLPIDCKFPREDYERLLEAQDGADKAGIELAARSIEARLRLEARAIRTKYVAPPHTTDFGIMFLPTEGLYAEALRRPGLVEALQRDHRVIVTGPTTLLATLTSLQMGFRTLALEKRTSEVWEVLGAVKTKFGEFGDALAKTKKKLAEASNTIEAAERSSRGVSKSLRDVEVVPDDRAQALLPGGLFDDDESSGDA
jgi:DNA recombination protein RmuC